MGRTLTCVAMWAAMFWGSAAIATDLPIAGTWRGDMNGLPAVLLNVKHDGARLSGTILFYFLHRKTEHDAWQVDTTHSIPLPLLAPQFDGKVLTFKVRHKEAHPPRTLNDPPSLFQLRLTGKGVAELLNLTERRSPGLKMLRDSK